MLTDGQLRIFDAIEGGAGDIQDVATRMGVHPNGGWLRGNFNRLRRLGVVSAGEPLSITEAAYR